MKQEESDSTTGLPECHGHSLEKILHLRLLELEVLILLWHHETQARRLREIVDYPVRWQQEGQDGCRIGHELVVVSCNVS